jgi:CRISPR/Cas system-associated protein Cas10 (large subunit of type III CRISPR-Cas system)
MSCKEQHDCERYCEWCGNCASRLENERYMDEQRGEEDYVL